MKLLMFVAFMMIISISGGCGWHDDKNIRHSGVDVENIQVENYFEIGPNIEYFTQIPSRVMVIGAAQTETLLDLEVGDSIKWAVKYEDSKDFPIKESNQEEFQKLAFISRQEITLESVLELKPDLIVSEESWFSKNRLGSTGYWNSKGIHTMVSLNTTSPGKMNKQETVEREMKYIHDMGRIYHREKQAETIILATNSRFDAVRKNAKGTPPKVMILDLLSTTVSYGRDKIAGDIAAKLGGEVPVTTAMISDEVVVNENPDVVFIITYDDTESRLNSVRNKKAFQHLKFIQNNRLHGIPLKYAYGPMTRVIDSAGYMAMYMYPGQFIFAKEYDFHSKN